MEDPTMTSDRVRRYAWERQAAEGEAQFGHFAVYRDMGTGRTIAKVAERVSRSRDYLLKLSQKHGWVRRVEAWDRWQDALFAQKVAERRRELAEQQLAIIRVARSKLIERLQTIAPTDLSPGEWMRWMEGLWRMEREVLGQPATTVGVSGPDGGPVDVQFGDLSDAQREAYFARLVAEAQSRAGVGRTGRDSSSMQDDEGDGEDD